MVLFSQRRVRRVSGRTWLSPAMMFSAATASDRFNVFRPVCRLSAAQRRISMQHGYKICNYLSTLVII
jgi:hypothetical protein